MEKKDTSWATISSTPLIFLYFFIFFIFFRVFYVFFHIFSYFLYFSYFFIFFHIFHIFSLKIRGCTDIFSSWLPQFPSQSMRVFFAAWIVFHYFPQRGHTFYIFLLYLCFLYSRLYSVFVQFSPFHERLLLTIIRCQQFSTYRVTYTFKVNSKNLISISGILLNIYKIKKKKQQKNILIAFFMILVLLF